MLASFSVIPVGAGEELHEHVARIMRLVERSKLDYRLGAMQTTVEGDYDQIMDLIMRCHRVTRRRAHRVQTVIHIDDHGDAVDRLDGKIADVEAVLGKELVHG